MVRALLWKHWRECRSLFENREGRRIEPPHRPNIKTLVPQELIWIDNHALAQRFSIGGSSQSPRPFHSLSGPFRFSPVERVHVPSNPTPHRWPDGGTVLRCSCWPRVPSFRFSEWEEVNAEKIKGVPIAGGKVQANPLFRTPIGRSTWLRRLSPDGKRYFIFDPTQQSWTATSTFPNTAQVEGAGRCEVAVPQEKSLALISWADPGNPLRIWNLWSPLRGAYVESAVLEKLASMQVDYLDRIGSGNPVASSFRFDL